ncbi:hypothetical protein [Fulvivirga sedimenti]|uniref:Uncharacterized protein n=1 Tax=Fulvivirga sedimenti TaxID=2879465 RepID=A0A9X1HRH9_9BACT|nr:hypothetical protein [Fulvivirga sedimenti]MCA6074669.1 hypothetical protein [Fulvivirga sedimenti]MCA6075846.1 hypothetical protein [Fulvivirga sedimenti]MCA6076974.1 hypothetical protein [Fulvivirga sedimenti]
MSNGIGFAGLGKYLNDKSLNLLRRGKGAAQPDPYREDLRESNTNKTEYEKLITWQREKRREIIRIRLIIFSVLFLVLLAITALLVF